LTSFDLVIVPVIAYLTVGAVVSLVHPELVRKQIADLKYVDVGRASFFCKPLMALAVFILFCLLWPVAWFNAGKSEKKTEEALAAQMERLRPFAELYAMMNRPVRYAGGEPNDSCCYRLSMPDEIAENREQWDVPGFGRWVVQAMALPVPDPTDAGSPTVMALILPSR